MVTDGLHCFNVPWFNRCSPHTTLIKCINALGKGNVSDKDVAFINSLSRSLENEENCVHLFSRNIDDIIVGYFSGYLVNGNRAMIEINIFSAKNLSK
jgi:hypothetical protein